MIDQNRTSSTSATVEIGQWTYTRKRGRKERLVRWYMGRVAGRYCPCEWPIKVRYLIRLCARIDDAQARYEFYDFAAFHLVRYRNKTGAA